MLSGLPVWLPRNVLIVIELIYAIRTSPGFNYDFDALNVHGKPDELSTAFNTLFSILSQPTEFLQGILDRVWFIRMLVCFPAAFATCYQLTTLVAYATPKVRRRGTTGDASHRHESHRREEERDIART